MYKLIVYFFTCLPFPLVMFLARLLFPFFYYMVRHNKLGLKTNRIILKVFKDKNSAWHEWVIKENTLHILKFAGEMLKACFASDKMIMKKCYIHKGEEFIEKLLKSGEGFTILTCHLGNWEWAAAFIALRYHIILYAPVFVEDSKENKIINWIREGHRIKLLEASRNPRISSRTLMKMIDLVQNGKVLYLVSDQSGLGGDFRGSFFGANIRIFGGPFIIGKKTGKPFLPMYSLRDKRNRIALFFEKPFYLNGENIDKDIARVMEFFEDNIREHPEQYLWSQDRWQ